MIHAVRSLHPRSFVLGLFLALALALNLGLSSSAGAQQVDTLFVNDYLFRGQQLVNSCRYRLVMQHDGNLVLYNHNAIAIWASNTQHPNNGGRSGAWAVMQPDGNFVVYDVNAFPLWASGTSQWGSSSLRLQSDRNVVVYDAGLTPRWATNTWTSALPTVPFCTWRGTKTNVWPGYDIPGNDFDVRTLTGSDLQGNPAALCAGLCNLQSQCKAFSYVDSTHQCWLKHTKGNVVQTNGVSAGAVTR